MATNRTPHNFLLYLRGRNPSLARLFDNIKTLSLIGNSFEVKIDAGRWPGSEILRRKEELEREVRVFFGDKTIFIIHPSQATGETLPFPVRSSKIWNHVAFFTGDGKMTALFVIGKREYERLVKNPEEQHLAEGGELLFKGRTSEVVPEIADRLTAFARKKRSYVHLVGEYSGPGEADEIEGRLYTVKEWGTPSTPAPIMQKYLGRIHWTDPENPPLGVKLAKKCL